MKKKNKLDLNKVVQIAMGAVFGGVIGFFVTRFIDKGPYNKPNGYGFILIFSFIAVYYLSVIIHELTHFLTFRAYGTEMRLLIMGPFIFNKIDDKWRFKFKFTGAFFMGGIAMPNLEVIDNEEKFERFRKVFARVLIAAPLSNLILNLIVIAATVVLNKNVQSEVWRNYISFIAIGATFISLFLNLSSFIKNDLVIGDYRAYFEVLKERDFAYICIYQYLVISSKYLVDDKKYIMQNICMLLENALEKKSFNNYIIGIVDNMLNDYLTGKIEELPETGKKYVDFTVDNCDELLEAYVNMELPLVFVHKIILYFSLEEASKAKALELYNKITLLVKHKTKVLKYYDLRSRHALGLENTLEYISHMENMKTSSLYELWRMFQWYYSDELKILNRIGSGKQA